MASGSSSCAIAVAGVRRGLLDREVKVELDGAKESVCLKIVVALNIRK